MERVGTEIEEPIVEEPERRTVVMDELTGSGLRPLTELEESIDDTGSSVTIVTRPPEVLGLVGRIRHRAGDFFAGIKGAKLGGGIGDEIRRLVPEVISGGSGDTRSPRATPGKPGRREERSGSRVGVGSGGSHAGAYMAVGTQSLKERLLELEGVRLIQPDLEKFPKVNKEKVIAAICEKVGLNEADRIFEAIKNGSVVVYPNLPTRSWAKRLVKEDSTWSLLKQVYEGNEVSSKYDEAMRPLNPAKREHEDPMLYDVGFNIAIVGKEEVVRTNVVHGKTINDLCRGVIDLDTALVLLADQNFLDEITGLVLSDDFEGKYRAVLYFLGASGFQLELLDSKRILPQGGVFATRVLVKKLLVTEEELTSNKLPDTDECPDNSN